MRRLAPLAAVALVALLATGCPPDEDADLGGSGLAEDDITQSGDSVCSFDEEFRAAVQEVAFGAVGPYPAGFDQVITHVGDQDYADSADSTDLFDVRGAYQICRYSLSDRFIVEAYLYWFAPTADRDGLEDAEAWNYALADVSSGGGGPTDVEVNVPVAAPSTDTRAAVVGVRASGGEGASAALSISVDGFLDGVDGAPGSLNAEQLSGPLPPEEQVLDLLGAIAARISSR